MSSSSSCLANDTPMENNPPPVVSLSIRKPGKKVGNPLLELEVLGDRHNFEDVGNLMFKYYLGERLGEELYDHVWRFEPLQGESDAMSPAMNHKVHLLSKKMAINEVFESDGLSEPCMVHAGMELIFSYDVGDPTILAVTIDSICPMPPNKAVEDYPLRKSAISAADEVRKRQKITSAPLLTITMDEAYPQLHERLLNEGRVKLDIGQGSDCMGKGLQDSAWAMIWGGGICPAYTHSLECYVPFTDMDEAWLCMEKGIEKQTAPGHPTMIRTQQLKSRTTGELYIKPEDTTRHMHDDFDVICSVYPSTVPAGSYRKEEIEDHMRMCSDSGVSNANVTGEVPDKVVKSLSTWSFNFALQADWRTGDPNNSRFSFVRQFPKCALWLTHPGKTSYWMSVEVGVLQAIKGRASMKNPDNVVHTTLKHTTLHAMFADMESQIVLPKAWKYKG